jgi:hypothetical protein
VCVLRDGSGFTTPPVSTSMEDTPDMTVEEDSTKGGRGIPGLGYVTNVVGGAKKVVTKQYHVARYGLGRRCLALSAAV